MYFRLVVHEEVEIGLCMTVVAYDRQQLHKDTRSTTVYFELLVMKVC